MKKRISLLLCCVYIFRCDSARILAVFPTPSISHQVVFRPLTQELAKRGHEVIVVTTDPAFPKGKAPPNLTEIDVHDISYEAWQKGFMSAPKGSEDNLFELTRSIISLMHIVFDKQVQSYEFQNILKDKNQTFDLLLLEACVISALSLSHVYKVPVIQISSMGPVPLIYEAMGAPTHPFLYPGFFRQKINNLTLWDKAVELYNENIINTKIFYSQLEEDDKMVKRHFGSDVPSLVDLRKNVDMLFINLHPVLEGNVPVPPSIIHIWGIHQKPDKKLPKDLDEYLNSSVKGVIYMSFGTNTDPSLLPPEKIQMFVKVFSQLPYDVLWKWNKDELPGRSKNIKIGKWFPQSDLLKHPKIKLFITQGGLQSTDEAITAGVPLIGVPMLGDQWYNVEKYVAHKIGVRLDLMPLTEEKLRDAINLVIEDESYRKNIEKLRSIVHDQPQPPLERAVWWTEHVLRHGGARHLRAPAANMSWWDYLELDLLFTLLLGLLFITSVFVYIVRYLYASLFVKKKLKIT